MWKSMQNGINFQYSTSAVAFGKSEKLIFAARNSIRVQQFARYLAKLAQQNSKNTSFFPLQQNARLLHNLSIVRKRENGKQRSKNKSSINETGGNHRKYMHRTMYVFMHTHMIHLCRFCVYLFENARHVSKLLNAQKS